MRETEALCCDPPVGTSLCSLALAEGQQVAAPGTETVATETDLQAQGCSQTPTLARLSAFWNKDGQSFRSVGEGRRPSFR